jgi:hypothetical protein
MRNSVLLFILIIASIFLSLIINQILQIDNLYISSLTDKLTYDQIQEFLNSQQKWQWLGYAIIPLSLLLKISIIAAIIDVGCFFFDKEIKYKKLFNIVVKAEFVFLLVIVFKTNWFYVFKQDYTLLDLQYFYPLSAINITGYQNLQTWFVYPLQVLNLFELAYWVILAYLLGKELKITTDKGLSIVASSYGVGLLIWVVAIMFLTLNMN